MSIQVIVFMGLPGTGKSTLARALQHELPITTRLATDHLRKQLFMNPQNPSSFLVNPYDAQHKDMVYNAVHAFLSLLSPLRAHASFTLIIEGTYHRSYRRQQLYNVLKTQGLTFHAFWLHAPFHVITQRLQERVPANADDSEANLPIYEKLKQVVEPPSPEEPVFLLDTEPALPIVMNTVLQYLQGSP